MANQGHTRHFPPATRSDRRTEAASPGGAFTSSSDDFQPSATYMPGNGDYFGDAWSNTSPKRPNRAREQGPLYPRNGSANTQINPGAKNSFAIDATTNNATESPAPQLGVGISSMSNDIRRNQDHRTQDSSNPRNAEAVSSPNQSAAEGLGPHAKRRKAPSQKAMLSQALQKANHAVVLDNAQNIEGAMDAYGDACDLLQQVMVRSSGDEDRRKLEKIVRHYRRVCTPEADLI